MKHLLIISLILFSFSSWGAPCGGAPVAAHPNPDGSIGGAVAKTASVSSSSMVDSSSSVCGRAIVQGTAKIRNGSEISGSAIIEGRAFINASKIKGIAKVYGNAIVTNSTVCQASQINFSVSDSNYYCDLEDDEPRDPGELGKKTVTGIDSNVNGIRDDVEIWINNNTTNTPNKDMYNERMALRQIAKGIQSAIKFKDNKIEARKYMLESVMGKSCLKGIVNNKELDDLDVDMRLVIINSEQRFFAWARAHASLSGLSLNTDNKRNCLFEKR